MNKDEWIKRALAVLKTYDQYLNDGPKECPFCHGKAYKNGCELLDLIKEAEALEAATKDESR